MSKPLSRLGIIVGCGSGILLLSFLVTNEMLKDQGNVPQAARSCFRLDEARELKSHGVVAPNGYRFYSSSQTDRGPERAFDGSIEPDSYWEVRGGFPFYLLVEFPQATTFSSYSFFTARGGKRMPAEWEVEGLQIGQDCAPIDQQFGVRPWKDDEKRNFRFTAMQPLQEMRFIFLRGFDPTVLRIYEIELHQ
jgi:hypothetical protein